MNEDQVSDRMETANTAQSEREEPTSIDAAVDLNLNSTPEAESTPMTTGPTATGDVSTAAASTTPDSTSPSADAGEIKERIVEQLKTVFDPEIPVNIYEMGLIYDVDVDADGATRIRMTLTTPMCPAAEELPPEVEGKARTVEGVTSVQLDLVWEPPWTPDMMSEAARLDLGMI